MFLGNECLYNYYSITILFAAICLFILFLNIKIESKLLNKIIPFVSSTTFGIYLIHENPEVRDLLWSNVKMASEQICQTGMLVIENLIIPIIIFVCSSCVDKIRESIFKLLYKSKLYMEFEKLIKKCYCEK